MLHRLVIYSAVLFTSTVAFTPAVLAESVDILFTGVVHDYAALSVSNLGQISPIVSSAEKSASKSTSVIPASLSVESSTSAQISISSPQLVSGSNLKSLDLQPTAALRIGLTEVTSDASNDSISLSAGATDLELDLLTGKSADLTPGADTYLVIVTVTSN
ncbi:MAG: hypothetical protein KME23_29365 [Goleter apudmare HA4340-LM2]|jgi:transglutaminase/protease-like cytokinesis protein 3|nr:hypothetical protein [Goleter apudmare HA4340-LM2]